jgi:conjugal transfer pilus assembly protein TrbC
LVFISFAMPDATLTRLVDQAARAQASLVLRGLAEGSLVRTVARVQQLIGSRKVAVQIDPQAFDRYAVTQTPTFVLVRDGTLPQPCATGLCVPGDRFARTAGDVSLDYALTHIQRSAPGFSKDAGGFLKRLHR